MVQRKNFSAIKMSVTRGVRNPTNAVNRVETLTDDTLQRVPATMLKNNFKQYKTVQLQTIPARNQKLSWKCQWYKLVGTDHLISLEPSTAEL